MSTEDKPENMVNVAERPSEVEHTNEISAENADVGLCEHVKNLDLGPHDTRNDGVAVKHRESESLNSLLAYESDSSSTSSEMGTLNLNWQGREDSKDSSISESSLSSDSESDRSEEEKPQPPPQDRGAIRKKRPEKNGELSLDQLPPVPDLSTLQLHVENESFVHIGNVLGIVDKLVTVAASLDSPAYDLDTLLFLDHGRKPLGFVFDVLGQVKSPIYAVRFNSVEAIKNLGVEIGTKVYSAPKSKHTQYVFLEQLLKMKGSDASWLDDREVPAEFADYSDDENECYRRFGNQKPSPHVKRTHSSDSYKKFESTMNKRNILNTRFNKYMDSYKQARLNKTRPRRQTQIQNAAPAFDPTVPPPTLRPFYPQSAGAVNYLPSEYPGAYLEGGTENNNSAHSQGYAQSLFPNNFVANLTQTNSANYFTNHAGNTIPGPSHE